MPWEGFGDIAFLFLSGFVSGFLLVFTAALFIKVLRT